LRKYNIIIFIIAFVIAGIFLIWAEKERQKNLLNGFNRTYLPRSPILKKKVSTNGRWHSIAGVSKDEIYLYGDTAGIFLVLNSDLTTSRRLKIEISRTIQDSIGSIFLSSVEDDHFFVYAFNVPAIVTWNRISAISNLIKLSKGSFTQTASISPTKIFLRKYDSEIQDLSLFRLNMNDGILQLDKQIWPIFHDGGITTSGQMHWDNFTHRLVYNYFYSNSWFSMDSNILDLRIFRSIDTSRNFKINVIRQGNYFTPKGDPTPVNTFSAVDHGLLFLQSTVRADNERPSDFLDGSTIDIYDDSSGKYRSSFHIPLYEGKQLRRFLICKNSIYVLYHTALAKYELRMP
jgi:hypothetical protein